MSIVFDIILVFINSVYLLVQYTCGNTSSYNNTYFTNTNFPNTFFGGGRCTMSIRRCNADICQVRKKECYTCPVVSNSLFSVPLFYEYVKQTQCTRTYYTSLGIATISRRCRSYSVYCEKL